MGLACGSPGIFAAGCGGSAPPGAAAGPGIDASAAPSSGGLGGAAPSALCPTQPAPASLPAAAVCSRSLPAGAAPPAKGPGCCGLGPAAAWPRSLPADPPPPAGALAAGGGSRTGSERAVPGFGLSPSGPRRCCQGPGAVGSCTCCWLWPDAPEPVSSGAGAAGGGGGKAAGPCMRLAPFPEESFRPSTGRSSRLLAPRTSWRGALLLGPACCWCERSNICWRRGTPVLRARSGCACARGLCSRQGGQAGGAREVSHAAPRCAAMIARTSLYTLECARLAKD